MDILTFEISGKFAHFRKYYANNTALSYSIPPRTALMGMIAAVMGYPKDSYYERLASEHIRLGICVRSPLKKRIHRINWLKVESAADFRGQKQHTQTPFEMVSAYDVRTELVRYEVFVAAHPSGQRSFEAISEKFLSHNQVFAISLGPANLGGSISQVQMLSGEYISESQGEFIPLSSAVNTKKIANLAWEEPANLLLEEELMPADFIGNDNRELRNMIRLLYAIDGNPLPVQLNGSYVLLEKKSGHVIPICFIE